MKKHILKIAACMLIAVLLIPAGAFADVIYEPREDFFESHRSDCKTVERSYTAKGPEGFVNFYQSPENSKVSFRLENGESIFIYKKYTDKNGTDWGLAELHEKGKTLTGWCPMDYMWECYSSRMFASQYSAHISAGNRELKNPDSKEIYFWRYPGSEYYDTSSVKELSFGRIFTDEQGREWGYVSYNMGIRDCWVLLDDPFADFAKIFPEGAPVYDTRENPGMLDKFGAGGSKQENGNQQQNNQQENNNQQGTNQQTNNNNFSSDKPIVPDDSRQKQTLLICCIAAAVVLIAVAVCLSKKKKENPGRPD